MSDSKHPLSSFEAALCAKPLFSDIVEMKLWGGMVAKWRWKEISQSRIDNLRRTAIQFVESDRRRKEGKDEWRDVAMDLTDMRATELDLLELHAAMVHETDDSRQACDLQTLRDRLSPDMQEHLGNLYHIWKASISPLSMGEEAVKDLVEDIKKNEGNSYLLLTQYDFATVLGCLDYMASQLMTYQTEQS